MGWKNWSYWLKGGMIGFIFYTGVLLIGIFNCYYEITDLTCKLSLYLTNFILAVHDLNGIHNNADGYGIIPFITFAIYIFAGMLVGWIYGLLNK